MDNIKPVPLGEFYNGQVWCIDKDNIGNRQSHCYAHVYACLNDPDDQN